MLIRDSFSILCHQKSKLGMKWQVMMKFGGVGTMDQISFKLVPRGISYGVSNIVGAPFGWLF
jgi:hypothetical protein